MSADEFWKDDPQLFVSYRTFFINKKKREMEELDYKCWLQGLYVYDGNNRIGARTCQTISNGFQGFSKLPQYDKKDYGTFPKEPYSKQKDIKKNEETNKYNEYQKSLLYQGSIKEIYLKKLTKGE